MDTAAPFHLSFCVADLQSARSFYGGVLGCKQGNSTATYVDFFFYGNQLTCHVAPERVRRASEMGLDGNHFGAIVDARQFDALLAKLRAAKVEFLLDPERQAPDQRARRKMIFTDPSGNAIEIKCVVGAGAAQ